MRKLYTILLLIFSPALFAQTNFGGLDSSQTVPKVIIEAKVMPETLKSGETGRVFVTFTFEKGFHQTKNEDFFFIAPDNSESDDFITLGPVEYPSGTREEGVENYYGSVTLSADITINENIQEGYIPSIKAAWQVCTDSGTCFFPEEKILKLPVSVISTQQISSSVSLLLLLKFILFAFIGGLLLNIMPCVLPILSLRALNLVNQRKNDKKSIFISSLLYGAGVLISLLILAVIVIILKLSGQMAGWGFQFQNPVFVSILMVIIFVFALSLFDVYVINPPGMTGMAKAAAQKGYIGSFFNGIFAVLLATPCTAPFLGAALGFAFSQPPLFILVSFAAIGAGFALPFILLGIWPKAIQFLPKPGPWMDTFKELMGFLLLGTVIYLFSTLRFEVSSDAQLRVIIYLLTAGFIAWIYGKLSNPKSKFPSPAVALVLSLILLIASGIYFLNFSTVSTVNNSKTEQVKYNDGWETFSPELLEKYRNEGRGVFVKFSAKWCTVCKVNDKVIFQTEKGNNFFTERNIARLYGDYTKKDSLIGEWIQKYGKAGVPVYVYYPPKSSDYILFPELLSWSILEDKINKKPDKKLDDSDFFSQS